MNPYESNDKRRLERIMRHLRMSGTPTSKTESTVQSVIKEVLDEYKWIDQDLFSIPADDESDPSAHVRRSEAICQRREIQEFMRINLGNPSSFFFHGCFEEPTPHWGLLHELAVLYEFGDTPDERWNLLHLRKSDRDNPKLVHLVWLANFLNVADDDIMALIAVSYTHLTLPTKA